MALRDLTTGEMIQISDGWTTRDAPWRAIFERHTLLKPFLKILEDAHTGLLAANNDVQNRDRELSQEANATDLLHDTLVRGVFMVLTGVSLHAARLQWIRVVNGLISNADLSNLNEEEDRMLFISHLRDAEQRAGRRTARRQPAALGQGEPEAGDTPEGAA